MTLHPDELRDAVDLLSKLEMIEVTRKEVAQCEFRLIGRDGTSLEVFLENHALRNIAAIIDAELRGEVLALKEALAEMEIDVAEIPIAEAYDPAQKSN